MRNKRRCRREFALLNKHWHLHLYIEKSISSKGRTDGIPVTISFRTLVSRHSTSGSETGWLFVFLRFANFSNIVSGRWIYQTNCAPRPNAPRWVRKKAHALFNPVSSPSCVACLLQGLHNTSREQCKSASFYKRPNVSLIRLAVIQNNNLTRVLQSILCNFG